MRNRTVTLVDLGLDGPFDVSMQFVQATLNNVNVGVEEPIVDVNFVRSRDPETIWGGLTTPSTVLHVMAHGDHSAEPAFVSSDGSTTVTLRSLADRFVGHGTGIASPIVLADGCKTGIGIWQRAIRDSLQGDVTYIGTSSAIGWHESTVFCAAFYGSLLRNKGRGRTATDQGMDAAARAIQAYEHLTEKKCPFRAVTLTPSRQAKAVSC